MHKFKLFFGGKTIKQFLEQKIMIFSGKIQTFFGGKIQTIFGCKNIQTIFRTNNHDF